ncbi:hypothetical protein MMC12_002153 [Toensbergia leucococca]|nr:hypothetical protein [Toensbergia leucococca]
MPSISYFSSPFSQSLHADGPRSSLHIPPRKRKRDNNSDDSLSHDSGSEDISWAVKHTSSNGISGSSSLRSSVPAEANFTKEIANQYQVAGQPFDAELPRGGFPHSVWSRTQPGLSTQGHVSECLATLKPPLFTSKGQLSPHFPNTGIRTVVGLRQRHLNMLTSILHRCMLEGDYARAGRAWAMLLRMSLNGHPMDIRTHGRWGIGAEILLQRDYQFKDFGNAAETSPDRSETNQDSQALLVSRYPFSEEAFDRVKDYYERLILQYPYSKTFPNSVNALDFYLAMFGLWIYIVQQQYKSSMENVENASQDGKQDYGDLYDGTPPQASSPKLNRSNYEKMEDIRTTALQRGLEIVTRLDELQLSPPYSDDARLWNLKGMVALWIGDLSISTLPEENGEVSSRGRSALADERLRGILARSQYDKSLEKKQAEMVKAKIAFENVLKRGETLWSGVDMSYKGKTLTLQLPRVGVSSRRTSKSIDLTAEDLFGD